MFVGLWDEQDAHLDQVEPMWEAARLALAGQLEPFLAYVDGEGYLIKRG